MKDKFTLPRRSDYQELLTLLEGKGHINCITSTPNENGDIYVTLGHLSRSVPIEWLKIIAFKFDKDENLIKIETVKG